MQSRFTHKIGLFLFLAGSFMLQSIPYRVCGQVPPTIDLDHKFNVYDVDGHPIVNIKTDVEGNPFFIADWRSGTIQLVDGRTYANIFVQLDLEKQTVHYKGADAAELQIGSELVRQVIIHDTLAHANPVYQFVTGLPPIDNQTANSFYLVLDTGKISFLECIWKKFYEKKNEYSGETNREYRIYNDFYIYTGGKIIRTKRDAKFFLALTNDRSAQMETYVSSNKTSFRSEEDIRRFLHYYNGLP